MFIDPRKVVEEWDLRPGMKAADFGAGSGHFCVEVAKRIGANGVVYAFDIQQEALDMLKNRAEMEHLSNIELRRTDLEAGNATKLDNGVADLVLITNMLFQVDKKDSIMKEAFRILKPDGRMIVIDWEPESGGFGPPKNMRISKDNIVALCEVAGFIKEKSFSAGDYHYGFVFKK